MSKTFTARVTVFPRPEILDPQGKAIRDALERLDFGGVTDVRAGKTFRIVLEAKSEKAAREAAESMADKLLANPIVEDYTVEVGAGAAEGD